MDYCVLIQISFKYFYKYMLLVDDYSKLMEMSSLPKRRFECKIFAMVLPAIFPKYLVDSLEHEQKAEIFTDDDFLKETFLFCLKFFEVCL